MPIFLANFGGTCTSLFLLGNTGRLVWQTSFYSKIFYFRDDFELLEVFEHCTSIPVELTS